jgi:hypothetical protein
MLNMSLINKKGKQYFFLKKLNEKLNFILTI